MVSTLKIELNGTLITGRIDGTEAFNVTYTRRDEEGNISASFTSELTFYDDGYAILKPILIDSPNGFDNTVNVNIYDDCCSKLVYQGIIRGDSIDWCDDGCYISANVIQDDAPLNCVKSTFIYDGMLGDSQPIIRYCLEIRPEFLHYLLILVVSTSYILIKFIFSPVTILLDLFGLLSDDIKNISENVKDIRDALIDYTINACGRFHPSAYVRTYIQNVCNKCGLNFQSSILNESQSPYYNTVLFSAPVEKGRDRKSPDYRLIPKNVPIETLDTLMTRYLKPMFNAEYRIIGNDLIFERKDNFDLNLPWIDVSNLLADGRVNGDKVCYSWIDKDRWAYGNFKYSMDAIDYCANEALDRWNDIVEWNPAPINKAQKGVREVMLTSSCARFREDGIDTSVYDFMKDFAGGFVNAYYYDYAFSDYRKVMLMPQHTTMNYKFLIYDPTDVSNGVSNGRVKNYYSDSFCNGNPGATQIERFNYPYWFKEGIQGVSGFQSNLYSKFHYIDNPRYPATTKFDFSFTFDFNCDDLNSFSFDKTVSGLSVNGNSVTGKVNEIVVNFTNRTITVKGIV